MTSKRFLIMVAAACGLLLVVAGVAGAFFRGGTPPSRPPDSGSPSGRRVTVAHFASAEGRPDRQVVVERTPDGYVCLWDSPDENTQHALGGCNDAGDPLGGHKLFASMTYDGGPDLATVRDPRLSGLTAADVDHVVLAMSDGSTRLVRLSRTSTRAVAGADYGSFAYRIHEADVRKGVTPVAVLAVDAAGHELDRQTTGIGN
jgi:hypothetical protein